MWADAEEEEEASGKCLSLLPKQKPCIYFDVSHEIHL